MIKTLILPSIVIIATVVSIAWVYDTLSEIRWEETRPLTWDDFRGIPNPLSPYGAMIKYNVKYQYLYEWKMIEGSCHYWFTKVEAIAYMSKVESFVKENARNDFVLNHEQGHFDISEINARKFNEMAERELINREFLCPGNDAGKINPDASQKVNVIHNRIMIELNSMQAFYDKETNHGKYYNEQKKWNSTIRKLLTIT